MHFRHEKPVTTGARPGALGNVPSEIQSIRVIDYDKDSVVDTEMESIAQCLEYGKSKRTTWLHVQGTVGSDDLRMLREAYNMHPLAVEDVLNIGQRPKFEPYDKQLFLIDVLPQQVGNRIEFEQISIFIGPSYVISFHDGDDDIFAPVRNRIHDGKGRIRVGSEDYLAYCLADLIVDIGFPVMERYAEMIESLEDSIFEHKADNPITEIHNIRRELIAMRRQVRHQTDMLFELLREGHELMEAENIPYWRDAADHSQRVLDNLETYLDMTSSLLDTHISLVSHRLNDVMKVLTIISTIFIPLSFMAGLYGMNFDTESRWNMPELAFEYGYVTLLGAMAIVVVGMLIYFKKKDWL